MSLATMKSPIIGLGGPSTHTNNQLLRFDGDNTKLIQTCPDIYVDDNGKLSIGLTSPNSKLQQAQFSADSTGSYHTFSKSRNATVDTHTIVQDNDVIGGIKFTPSDGADFGTISALIQAEVDDLDPVASSIGGALTFSTAKGVASDDLTERLRINKNGNVGIGTTTPNELLHINTTSGNAALKVETTDTAYSSLYLNGKATGGEGAIGQVSFSNNGDSVAGISVTRAGANDAGNLKFYTQPTGGTNTERMRITSAGNVGIGETDPETLTEWSSTAPYLTLHNTTEEDIAGGRESKIIFKGEQSGGEETTLAVIQASHDGSSDDEKCDLIFSTNKGTDGNSPTERMRIDSAGLVSITGSAKVGDGGTTNYCAIAADGEINLYGTARVYQSNWVSAENFKVPATNPADLVEYGIGSALEFGDEAVNYEYARLRIKVPSDIDSSVQPILILGWSCPSTGVNVRWELEYNWRAVGEAMDAAAEGTVTDNYAASGTAKGLVMTQVQLANFSSSDVCFTATIARRSDNAGDTATGAVAHLHGACLYYVKNKLGIAL